MTGAAGKLPRGVSERGQPARKLSLDPTARIVFGEHGVHLVHRRGAFELRGKDLRRLHERLSPVLDGRFTRAQILSSSGPHTAAVARYLDGLSEAGVLCEGQPPEALPPGFPKPRSGPQTFRTEGFVADVNLAGSEHSRASANWLSFVSRSTVERRLLLDSGTSRTYAGRTWVICDGEPDSRELERRAAIARHLLALQLGRRDGANVSVFELASDRMALRRVAIADSRSAPLASLPEQLQLVRMFEHDQLPLAVWAGELPGLGRSKVAYGLDARELKSALTVTFLGRETLIERASTEAVRGRRAFLGDRAAFEVTVTRQQSMRSVVGTSASSCACELVSAWAARSLHGATRPIDLLEAGAPSLRVDVLQDMLRRREKTLRARFDDRFAPLVVLRFDSIAVARIGYEEALCEMLLRILARHEGLNDGSAVPCAPARHSAATIRRRLRTVLARLPHKLPVITGRIRSFGSTLFFAIPADDDSEQGA